jgi:energy-coupling factor transport system ATP-binding protein
MIETKLSLKNISFTYGEGTPFEIKALKDVSLDIKSGIITGIIGHTGSGKSTLVQMLNGLLKPSSGQILLDGEDIWAKPKEISKVRYQVGLVMQYPEYQLFEETVKKDIAYAPTNMGLDEAAIDERVMEAADFAGVDRSWLDKSPFDLSGGQKRRVAIAGIMAMRPKVLVLDEPAAGLDPRGRDEILGKIREYQKETGSTVIMISHSMEDLALYCDKLVVMHESKPIMAGTCEEIFSRADELEKAGLAVPQVTKLMIELAAKGYDVNTSVYTVEAAKQELLRVLGGEAKC